MEVQTSRGESCDPINRFEPSNMFVPVPSQNLEILKTFHKTFLQQIFLNMYTKY